MASLPPPVDRILKAADGHDTDAFLACFSEDGVVVAADVGGRDFRG
jgi:hypothetical protein